MLKGTSSTIALVGPSKGGKSFSLRGDSYQTGLIHFATNEVLNFLAISRQNKEKNFFLAKFSIYQVFREQLNDLLGKNPEEALKIRKYKEDGAITTEIQNLQEFDLISTKEFTNLLNKAMDVRKKIGTKLEVSDIKNKGQLVINIRMYKVTSYTQDGVHKKITQRYAETNFVEFSAADYALPGCKKIEKIGKSESISIKRSYKSYANNLASLSGAQSSIRDSILTNSLKNTLTPDSLICTIINLAPNDSPATQKACLDVKH